MVKQRDQHGLFQRTMLGVIYGSKSEVIALLDKIMAFSERNPLTSRFFNGRQVIKTLTLAKDLLAYRAEAIWEDCYHNLFWPPKPSIRVKNHHYTTDLIRHQLSLPIQLIILGLILNY